MNRVRTLSFVVAAFVIMMPIQLAGSASARTTAFRWNGEGTQPNAQFGFSVATAGDVNGDGYDDVIVGAPRFDQKQSGGQVQVYLGGASGLPILPSWTNTASQPDAFYGSSVSSAGDVNGDGFDDILVGAVFYDGGEHDEGLAVLYLGSPSGPSSTPAWTAKSNQANGHFGRSVRAAGDVNGDGFDDVIIGANTYDDGETNEGGAFLFLGLPTGLTPKPVWRAEGEQDSAFFGFSVDTAGDVNGDGFADVIVGAYGWGNGGSSKGRAYVYLGSHSGLSTTPAWTEEGSQYSAHFGYSVGGAGDVNGDGFDDVIVGSPLWHQGQPTEGRALVYFGSALGLSTIPGWTVAGEEEDAELGSAVGTAGDMNGDGFDDVIVGAPNFDYDRTGEGDGFLFLGIGGAKVYLGSPTGPSSTAAWSEDGRETASYFGTSVGTAGDVNGDGLDEVIIGAPRYDHGTRNQGRATVRGL